MNNYTQIYTTPIGDEIEAIFFSENNSTKNPHYKVQWGFKNSKIKTSEPAERFLARANHKKWHKIAELRDN